MLQISAHDCKNMKVRYHEVVKPFVFADGKTEVMATRWYTVELETQGGPVQLTFFVKDRWDLLVLSTLASLSDLS